MQRSADTTKRRHTSVTLTFDLPTPKSCHCFHQSQVPNVTLKNNKKLTDTDARTPCSHAEARTANKLLDCSCWTCLYFSILTEINCILILCIFYCCAALYYAFYICFLRRIKIYIMDIRTAPLTWFLHLTDAFRTSSTRLWTKYLPYGTELQLLYIVTTQSSSARRR